MATWAKGIDFKNSANTARIGGIGVYGTDTTSEKIYIGLGAEPWSNTGLQLTTSAINFKGNKIYHAGDKPTPAEIGAATSSHTHNYAGSSSAGGSANSAVKLATTRKLTIGSTGKSFDGSADVNWSLSEIGAAAASHSHNYLPLSGGAVTSSNFGPLVIKRSGSTNAASIVFSNDNGTLGSIGMTASKNGGLIRWTDDTASNYTILDTGNYKSFVTPASIGAAASSHSHSYLPLSGGTLTGAITIKGSNKNLVIGAGSSDVYINNSASGKYIQMRDDGGLTYSGNKIYHAGDKPTLSELGAAAASHNHDVLISAGSRIASADIAAKGDRGLRMYLATSSMTTGKPAADGYILNFDWDTTAGWSSQMYIKNSNSPIMQIRGMNAGTWGSWYTLYSTNNKPTPAEIGAAAASHSHSYIPLSGSTGVTGTLRSNSEIQTTSQNAFRAVSGNYGFFIRNDGLYTWFMLTNSGDQYGNWNSLRPISINNSTGLVTFGNGLKGTLDGNASTATTLQNARTINDVSFNGSSNITIPLKTFVSNVSNDNTKNYHRILSSGVVTGSYADKTIILMGSGNYSGGPFGIFKVILRTNASGSNSTCNIEWMVRKGFGLDSIVCNMINTYGSTVADIFYKCAGTYAAINWTVLFENNGRGGSYNNGSWTKYTTNASGTEAYTETEMKALRSYTSTLAQGSDTTVVNSANKLASRRTLTIGSTGKSFDGTSNVSWSLSEIGAASSSHTHNYAGSSSAGGAANSANTLATARTINGTSFNGSANITTANWGTARTITIGSTGKSVNGSGNVSWSLSEIGAAAASHSHSYLPLSGGTLTGTMSSSVSSGTHLAANKGAAVINATASGTGYNMLAKANSTNGVWTMGSWGTNFCFFYTANSVISAGTNGFTKQLTLLNESGNSSFPGTVSASSFSGSLSGNASTATTLQTARTINGTSFNGSGNITTANWGTARTITVGSTAKSVNGSANIGWTLAEIGAVPSYTGGSTTIHADSDASSTSEYLLLKAGHNELKIASSAGGTTVTKGQDKLTFNGNIVYHAGRKPTASEIGAAASSHSHSYLPLSGGTITSNGFTIKTTTTTDSSGYITFQDTSGKRRAYITSNSGSSGIKIHTYDSAGTWKSNFVIEEDGSVHIGNGYLKAISEIWGRESSINLNIKKGTGFQGGARFNWTGATTIGAPRFQMIPMDSYDLRVGSPENPIHVVYGRVGYVTTSDREAKTNIHYIDDMQPLGLTNKTSVDEVKTLTKDDFYNFFKDEIRFASYDFKEANLENLETNLGFMAQDIADTKVGSKIVIPPREKIEYYHEDGTITEEKVDNGMYSFSTTNFASATAIALQKAIEKIEILENQIALLNEKLGL